MEPHMHFSLGFGEPNRTGGEAGPYQGRPWRPQGEGSAPLAGGMAGGVRMATAAAERRLGRGGNNEGG